VGAWIHAPEHESLPLVFSDGSRIELSPTARARLLVLEPREARVLLESGRMRVEVARRPGQDFSLATGPFTVRVTGTRFDVSYGPEQDRFELVLEEGEVELTGCVFGDGRKLIAGQRVRASCRGQELDVAYSSSAARVEAQPPGAAPEAENAAEASEASAAAGTDEARPSASADALRRTPQVSATEPAAKAKDEALAAPDWVQLARQGRYDRALAAAEAGGFSAQCKRASAAELALLADSARQVGQLARAREAFSALRRRFPGTKEASLAAFSLGLLEFDGAGSYGKAAEWFKTYLRESPGGSLAREARGRLMEASHRSGEQKEARALAEKYLLDYPAGPHAELARRIVASP
jgi:TolA-binding protein